MKTSRSFTFATELSNFFKLESKKAEIGKYFIQKYEMVYVLKKVLSDREFNFEKESLEWQSDACR